MRLGVDAPTDILLGAVLGVTVPLLALRLFAPEDRGRAGAGPYRAAAGPGPGRTGLRRARLGLGRARLDTPRSIADYA